MDNAPFLVVIKMKIIVKAERNLQLLQAIHTIRDPIRPSLLLQFWQIIFLSHTTYSLLFLDKHLGNKAVGQQQFSIEHMERLTLGTAGVCPSKKQQLESIKNWPGWSISEPSSVTARLDYSVAVQSPPPPAIVSHLMKFNHPSFRGKVGSVAGCLS